MNPKTIIDEDMCAQCANCSLLVPIPRPGFPWELPAICAAGFPYTHVLMNQIAKCPSFEKSTA